MKFSEGVYEIVKQIPTGQVVSYGQIARMLGNPRGARQVGWAMANCPDGLPWQRVVMADGSITGGVWADLRRSLLLDEGVPFLPDGRVDMKKCVWNGEEKQEVWSTP
ncbi:MAG: MGMT family protein [Defluviitaleaceae bacterium]|nr:MGMT family protein [Defluviitaleaceae bacterium]